jgi:ribulose-5-phosphate 4-epimerase/fuculose-1-phosphate aldolase
MGEATRQLKTVQSESVQHRVSKEEWDMRCDLAAAYRLAAHYRWTDLIYTHFSARVPGTDYLLINPYGMMFDEVTASSLVKIDEEGNVIDDVTGLGINRAGFVIHGCVHQARPEIACVIHTHTRAGVAVSAQKHGLLPISQHALTLYGEITYHDYEGVALEMDERERIASDLGPTSKAMIMRNHGLLSLGATVGEAFNYMYYLDASCQIQIDALAAGNAQLNILDEATARKGYAQIHGPDGNQLQKEWPTLLRMLDRKGDVYRV